MTPPAYTIEWAGPARRALGRLPEKVATAVIEFAYAGLAENPHRVGRPLRFDLEGLHSARRGDHRILYLIHDPELIVVVLAVEHRSDVYRPRS